MPNLNKLERIMYQILARFKLGPYEKYGFHYTAVHGTQDVIEIGWNLFPPSFSHIHRKVCIGPCIILVNEE